MQDTNRQLILLAAVMFLLTVVMLFLFVYAPEPIEPLRPSGDQIVDLLKTIFEKMNIVNYL